MTTHFSSFILNHKLAGVGVIRSRFWSLRVSRGSAGQPSNLRDRPRLASRVSSLAPVCLLLAGPLLFSPARHSATPARLSNRAVAQSSSLCARARRRQPTWLPVTAAASMTRRKLRLLAPTSTPCSGSTGSAPTPSSGSRTGGSPWYVFNSTTTS